MRTNRTKTTFSKALPKRAHFFWDVEVLKFCGISEMIIRKKPAFSLFSSYIHVHLKYQSNLQVKSPAANSMADSNGISSTVQGKKGISPFFSRLNSRKIPLEYIFTTFLNGHNISQTVKPVKTCDPDLKSQAHPLDNGSLTKPSTRIIRISSAP